ncbi:MAG TPA: lysophospholipid acyltransferase family protein [Bacteroidales bacterium]|nr:lysophospholipid acyltransferase family protein [Bacteroidales bacterium]
MIAVLFYIFYITNWIITLLPLSVLYLFSYPLYFLLYHFPGYRKQVVLDNLTNAFPEKSLDERLEIRKKYYKHLSDLIIEVLKLQHLGNKEIKRRFRIRNIELFDSLQRKGRSSIAAFGHYANWEWTTGVQLHTDYKCLAVYKPLLNRYFDRYTRKIRSKYGVENIAMADTLKTIVKYRNMGVSIALALISDQTPPKREIQYWTNFLNQDTPVYLGIEKLSRKYDMPVLFFRINKIKRGYYELIIESITEDPLKHEPNYITEKHVRLLEEQINRKPELWLWSHRRWKHKREKGL